MTAVFSHWYRGGTSKCWFFSREDVQATGLDDSELLMRAFGAEDHRQIDGVGGATSTTSKAAIISHDPDSDVPVTYKFAQVGIGERSVEYASNCGNCASAVALYALQQNLVPVTGDLTDVRMRHEHSGSILVGRVHTPGGVVPVNGDATIPGHKVPGVAIDLGFENPGGGSTGKLLPTGNAIDELADESGMLVRATLVDAGAPACLIPATDLGLSGHETIDEFALAVPELKLWRRRAALAMGLSQPSDPVSHSVPKVGIVGAPEDYVTTNGENISGGDYDVSVRMVSMHAPHPAIGITSAVAVAAAAGVPGSSVAALLPPVTDEGARTRVLRIGIPAGVVETSVELDAEGVPTLVTTRRVARHIASATIDLPDA